MNAKAIERYWEAISRSGSVEELRAVIAGRPDLAGQALGELFHLLQYLEPLQHNFVVDQIQWLGIQLADASGNSAAGARLRAWRLTAAGLKAVQTGDRNQAVACLSQAAVTSLQGDDAAASIRTTHIVVTTLFSLGATDAGLDAAVALVDALEPDGYESSEARLALYDLVRITHRAPAAARWANVLARIRRGLEQAGDIAATAVSCHLAATLILQGAHEDGLELLVDSADMLSRLGIKQADGTMTPATEIYEAHFWKGLALDLAGREADAEKAYRSHPHLTQGFEIVTRLAQLLIEGNRLQEALDILQSLEPDDSDYQALAQSLLGIIYARLNRFGASKAAAAHALSLLEERIDQPLGDSAFQQMLVQASRKFFSVFVPEETHWRVHLAISESAVIRGHADKEQLDKLEETLAWARRFSRREMEAHCLRLKGEVSLVAGDTDAAIESFQEALKCELTSGGTSEWKQFGAQKPGPTPLQDELQAESIYRRRKEAGVGIESLFGLGRAKAEAGLDPTAEFGETLGAAKRRNRRMTLFYALAAKARWLTRAEHGDQARKFYRDAVDVLESLRAEVSTIESQIGVMEDKESIFGELLLSAVEEADAPLANRLMERGKARGLLEEMDARSGGRPLQTEEEQKARYLRQQLVRAKATDPAQRVRLERIRDRFASLYRQSQPAYKSHPGGRAEDVVRLSAHGGAVIEYYVSESEVIATVARDGQLIAPMQLGFAKTRLARLFETLQFEIATGEHCHSLTGFYTALIQPFEQFINGAERIVFIPHGVLHMIPLHAARRPNGEYLVESCPIQYAPSAAVCLAAARGPAPQKLSNGLLLAADQTPYRADLPGLPYARSEIEQSSSWIPEAKVLLGSQALRRHLLRQKMDVDILHLACHGEFDDKDPLLSRVYLADGPLYGYEIERLTWKPRLAILSACETAAHLRAAGDETFGLVRTLLGRGAEAVVASLWKVGDQSAAKLMRCFYENLSRRPSDVAGALQDAQRELLSTPEHAHPFFWAPYVVIGGSHGHIPEASEDARHDNG